MLAQVSALKLQQLLQRMPVDPNDPRNAKLLGLLKLHAANQAIYGGRYTSPAPGGLPDS